MGFLREHSAYKAKARYYAGGPVSDIEFYAALPGAAYYSDVNAFFPMNDYIGETHTGVGELTDQGSRSFNRPPVPNPPPGVWVHGTASDFAGITTYPGVPGPGDIPDCSVPPVPPPPPPLGDPDRLRLTLADMVLEVDGVEYTLSHEMGTFLRFPAVSYSGWDPDDGVWSWVANFRYVAGVPVGWGGNFFGAVGDKYFGIEFSTTNYYADPVTTSIYTSVVEGVFPLPSPSEPAATVIDPGTLTITPEWD